MINRLDSILDKLESILALVVLIGLLVFFVASINTYANMDWSNLDTFYEFVNYVLAIVVGVELSRLLITHDIFSITNLLTFVVARKLLKPDLEAIEIFWGILAFGILFTLSIAGKEYKKRQEIQKLP